jgi:hypothetical protein
MQGSRSSFHHGRGEASVEGRKLAAVRDGQRQEIAVGDLTDGRDRSWSNNAASRKLMSSGQKTCPGKPTSRPRRARASAGVATAFGYFGLAMIRTRPFSVIGQVAHSRRPSAANQTCADSWLTCEASISAIKTLTSRRNVTEPRRAAR